MEFNKSSGGGAWIDKKTLKNGDIAKLVTEAVEVEGQNGPQIVAKIRIKGDDGEAKSVAINAPTRNALIDAFGKDSKNWCGQLLTVNVESGIFAGRRGIMLNLIPEGFEVGEDAGGYLTITRKGASAPASAEGPKDDINPDDIPF